LKAIDEQMSCLAFSQTQLACKEETQYLFYCLKKEKNKMDKCSFFGDDLLHCLKDNNAIFNCKFN
jgi:FMN phosphatase YigB (HAD superfamily)